MANKNIDEIKSKQIEDFCNGEKREADLKLLAQQNYQKLPPAVKNRVRALKNIQLSVSKKEQEYYNEFIKLETKYNEIYAQINSQQQSIVNGSYEPSAEETRWNYSSGDEEDDAPAKPNGDTKNGDSSVKLLSEELEAKIELDNGGDDIKKTAAAENLNIKGIPDFWLTVFKNIFVTRSAICKHDEPILSHMTDLRLVQHSEVPTELSFILEFYFSPNEYFTNSVLTKEYIMDNSLPTTLPFEYDGPAIVQAKGCIINWNEGKNVTVKRVRKTQKNRSGEKRTITKVVPNDSFFSFFSPPPNNINDEEMDSDVEEILDTDFVIGEYLKDQVVNRAVLYYTGEALEDEDDDEEEGEDDENDEDFDDDESDESEDAPRNNKGKNHAQTGKRRNA